MSDEERLLADAAALDGRWDEAATDMTRENWELAAQAEYYGVKLADAVVTNRLNIEDLRDFVRWANDLDREVVEVSGGEMHVLSDNDRHEALARRIAHHSGRVALGLVGSREGAQIHRMRYRRRVDRRRSDDTRGLFQLEAKDLGL